MDFSESTMQVNELKQAKEMVIVTLLKYWHGLACCELPLSLLEKNVSQQITEETMRALKREQLLGMQACLEDKEASEIRPTCDD